MVPCPATQNIDTARIALRHQQFRTAGRRSYFFLQALFLVAFLAVLLRAVFLAAFLVAIADPPLKKPTVGESLLAVRADLRGRAGNYALGTLGVPSSRFPRALP